MNMFFFVILNILRNNNSESIFNMQMYNNVLYPKVSPVPIARDVKKQYNLRTPRLETKSEKWNNLVQ